MGTIWITWLPTHYLNEKQTDPSPVNKNSMPWTALLLESWVQVRRETPPLLSRTTSPSVTTKKKERKKKRSNSLIEMANCLVMTHFQIYRHDKKFLMLRITCVVSGFMVKIASCKLPRKESMTRAPDIIKTPIELKLGDVCASAKVKRISPTTRSTAETYSWNGYFLLKPGMKAPIIMTGSTWILV